MLNAYNLLIQPRYSQLQVTAHEYLTLVLLRINIYNTEILDSGLTKYAEFSWPLFRRDDL